MVFRHGVVQKESGAVRICIDLKPLNENILQEVYSMPHVDETLVLLVGAKVISKLKTNNEFWQVPLAESSRHLTTFIMPFGQYCFNKLPLEYQMPLNF